MLAITGFCIMQIINYIFQMAKDYFASFRSAHLSPIPSVLIVIARSWSATETDEAISNYKIILPDKEGITLNNSAVYDNEVSYFYFYETDGSKKTYYIKFAKNKEGYWQIDSI